MIWLRRGVVYLLSLLLFVTLLDTAFTASFNQTVGQPDKVKAYLAQSDIYDHFVAYVADQAKKSEGAKSGSVSLSDAAVQGAAKSAFPASLIQQSVNEFLDANYAWLQGKTSVPEFKVDLSAQKETFAQKVGEIVKNYTAGLPVCTPAQAAQQADVDPLAAMCRVKGVKPAEVGAQVTQQLSGSSDFLSNPVLTAASVNPNGNQHGKPYYERLSRLPKAYQWAGKLPYITGALSLLFALGIVFISITRRSGFKKLTGVLAVAGIVLVVDKLIADFIFTKAQNEVFNKASVGPIQQSLTDFAHRVEASMVRTEMWFGIAYLLLALILFIILMSTRQRPPKAVKADNAPSQEPENHHLPLLKARKRLMRPFGDSIMPLGAKPGGEEPEAPSEPLSESEQATPEAESQVEPPTEQAAAPTAPKPKRKKPRLIQ